MKFKLILVMLLFLLIHTGAQGHGITRADQQAYNTMYIDNQNMIWLGSQHGLFCWSNNHAEAVPHTSGLNITAVFTSQPMVLMGTQEGGIYMYNLNAGKLNKIGDFKSEISAISLLNQTMVIASKGNGLIRVTPYSIELFALKEGLNDLYISSACIDSSGNIWSASDLGVNVISSISNAVNCSFNQQIPDRLVTAISLKGSRLYCGTQSGDLCRIDLSDSIVQVYPKQSENQYQINDLEILDHEILIATSCGVFRMKETGEFTDTITSLPGVSVGKDLEGSVWTCGDPFLISSHGEQMNLKTQLNGTPLTNIHALIMDSAQNLFLTPDNGLLKFPKSGRPVQMQYFPFSKETDITSFYFDAGGTLWVGTIGQGLYRIDTSDLSYTRVPIDSSVETSGVLSITGNNDCLWIASLNGVWYTDLPAKNYRFKSLEDEYKKKKYYVYQVKKDRKGDIWLATDGQGILHFTHHEIHDFSKEKGIPGKVFYSVEQDGLGQMWFNASADGLYCCGDQLKHLTTDNGLSSNDILSISQFGNDFLLACNARGIDIIDIRKFEVSHLSYKMTNLNIMPESNAIVIGSDNTAYIGTDKGLLSVYLPSYKSRFTPSAHIKRIFMLGEPCPKDKTDFNADQNNFKFSISSCFNSGQPIYYRYRLTGLNEHWIMTTDKEVTFPRLTPGDYEFEVQASANRHFERAASEKWPFTIRKPFWRTTWFIILGLSSAVLSFYYYIRYRDRRVSRIQQLEKEKAIAEFETLKHQVNPHFLFNSFNTLLHIIDEDPRKAIEYTQTLSDFYRTLLSYRNQELVELSEDIKLLDQYLYLQKMRFGDNLEFKNQLNPDLLQSLYIPPLTLQLLAENAIKHNIISDHKPLTLTLGQQEDYLLLTNNINKKKLKEPGENIGLTNIINRFKLFSEQAVIIEHNDSKFEVKLPFLINNNNT